MGLCESRPEAAQAKRVPPVSPMEIVRGSSRTLFDHGHGSGLQRTPSVAEVKMETALQDLHQIVDIADVTVVRKIGEGEPRERNPPPPPPPHPHTHTPHMCTTQVGVAVACFILQ